MFKSIFYCPINSTAYYGNSVPKDSNYVLIDSDFTTGFYIPYFADGSSEFAYACVKVVKEYQERNMDVVNNLFLMIKFITDDDKVNNSKYSEKYSPEQILNKMSLMDTYFPNYNINFKNNYYPQLKEKVKILSIFK